MRNLEGAEMWTRFASLEPGTRPASSGDGEGGGARLSGFEAIAGPGPNESELLEWIKGHWAECYEFDRASTREERHRKVKVREDAKKVAGLSSMPC